MSEPTGPRVGIISYCDRLRTNAHVNHELYARAHGYTYIFDIAPVAEPAQHKNFFLKLAKIKKFLPLFDWLFWIDDDAFFTGRKTTLTSFIDAHPDATIIFCASPKDTGLWTWMSSGTMLIRNTELGRKLIDATIATDLAKAREWWDDSVYGYWTGGDQDALVYQMMTNPDFAVEGFYAQLDYTAFNCRPRHFVAGGFEHFVLHFTGKDKGRQSLDFAEKWGMSEALTYKKEMANLRGLYPAAIPPRE